MVCTANDLQEWKDFPKGLRVLLLDGDSSSAAEIRSKLEAMDYIVTTFCNENEALTAIVNKPESFHVAIVEVGTSDNHGSVKFLETAKDVPTIMTSNVHCLSTMMKCIALGAVEFLRKPLSEDKLRNIWQHVVHKAFNAGGSILCESLKPVKESVASMLQLPLENGELNNKISSETKNGSLVYENDHEHSGGSDKYPAPSTPQLKQGARLLDDGDCQDQTNCSTEKDNGEQDGESKSVETTCGDSIAEGTLQDGKPQTQHECLIKEDEESADGFKSDGKVSPHQHNKDNLGNIIGGGAEIPSKPSGFNSSVTRANRKKMKKYRMHKRHILPKEEELRWPHARDAMQRSYYPHRPVMAIPSYHSSHTLSMPPVYPMWGPPGSNSAGVQMWGTGYPAWQPTDNWNWKPYPGMAADAWGCPVMTPPHCAYPSFPQDTSGIHHAGAVDISPGMTQNSFDLYPADEVIDKVVKEAISKPWLPLPLGLKPPSTESVLTELSRQGISTIPPHINGSHPF
ncbi:hypothetical protein F2P56_004328 [Juglans regia]|uniref:Response regulatory domain-containing protein n=2 Tax=Juglans regia TaxID=51240 RepID=A0A833Y6R6_JUGRE|nr:two-component response regulator-like APRR2 isoform X2 [Juglans regia]KAF5477712.1 hypothetical protein F2P56_004328 [Juglans regia]